MEFWPKTDIRKFPRSHEERTPDDDGMLVDYIDDIRKLQRIMLDAGWDASLRDAFNFWEWYSDELCASFLDVPDTIDEKWLKEKIWVYETQFADRVIDPSRLRRSP